MKANVALYLVAALSFVSVKPTLLQAAKTAAARPAAQWAAAERETEPRLRWPTVPYASAPLLSNANPSRSTTTLHPSVRSTYESIASATREPCLRV